MNFDEYHAACVLDGTRDGQVAELDDAIAHLPGVDVPHSATHDYSRETCLAVARAYVATFEASDWIDGCCDREECIPEIAFEHWRTGFAMALADRLYHAMGAS